MKKKKIPLCKCGCGSAVTWSQYKKEWNIWCHGHFNKGTSFSKAHCQKLSEAQKKSSHFHIYNKTKVHSQKVIKSNTRRHVSEKTKQKISVSVTGFKHTEETKLKMSLNHSDTRKNKSPLWKGGISPYGCAWATISCKIKKRDKFICTTCKKTGTNKTLHVHHIDFNKKNNESINLITLCRSCHSKLHPKGFITNKTCNTNKTRRVKC